MAKQSVWWVESGEYSDYRVNGVFSTYENAKKFADTFGGEVVELVLDAGIDLLNKGLLPKRVLIYRDGEVGNGTPETLRRDLPQETEVYLNESFTAAGILWASSLCVIGWFKSDEHAAKVANEKRVQLIASGEWKPDPPNAHKYKRD